jgi:L-lysine exporter family protein LysE/ArgO
MIQAFIYGIILALGLIIPLGIQNIFVFNQGATQKHFLHAMPCVLTASLCDTLLIILAVLGVSLVILTIPWLKTTIFVFSACFLIYIGLITWKSRSIALQVGGKPFSAKKQILFTMSVSLLNPHALLDTISIIGTSSLNFTGYAKWSYTIACILVSFVWFFALSITGFFFHKLDKTGRFQLIINKISALIIWMVAVYIVFQIVKN